MDGMILLSDKRIFDIVCSENNESMVSLRGINKKIHIDESRKQISNRSDFFCYVRETVAIKLVEALKELPEGYDFLIKEAYRSLIQQEVSFERTMGQYKLEHPEMDDDKIYELTCHYVAPVIVAGHPTGGAIDITLMKNGKELDMGTEYNAAPDGAENLTFLDSDDIDELQKENRRILAKSLVKVGFINYPTEWWHWSYGDRYWAFQNNCKALYLPVEEERIAP